MTRVAIPDSHIDYDFRLPPGMGGIVPSEGDATFGATWPSSLRVFDRSEWADVKREQEVNLGTVHVGRLYLDPWNDQSPESSCVYNSAESTWRYCWTRQLGKRFVMKCSPMSGYGCVTRRRHSGSTMWGAMERLTEVGLLPESSSAMSEAPGLSLCHDRAKQLCRHHFHQNTPFATKDAFPDGWRVTAKHFRVLEWVRLDTREQFASARLHRMPICYGRSGHAICGCDLVQDERRRWLCEYLDSYDRDRGDHGRLYDTERHWSTGGAWAAASVVLPDDPTAPAGSNGLTVSDGELARLYPAA